MIDRVLDENLPTSKRAKDKEMWGILKMVFGIFTVIIVVLYYVGIYFTLYDKDSEAGKQNKQ